MLDKYKMVMYDIYVNFKEGCALSGIATPIKHNTGEYSYTN